MPSDIVFRVTCRAVDALSRWVLRVRFAGVENIPRSGPAILAINHAAWYDSPIAGARIGLVRPFRSIGKKELFDIPVLGSYLRAMGGFPVDRDRADHGALKAALGILERGNLFFMAPEGTRGHSGRARTPKAGVAFLAHHSGAPVVPIHVGGLDGPPLPGRIWVRIGEPLRFAPGTEDPVKLKEAYKDFAERLMKTIYALPEPPAL